MAIGIFRSLEFGGINSADYDVYITGEAVYNAPERSVETVSVPGRNGAVLIDNGYFENIEVKYPAGVTGTDQSDFASKIADFRSAILSQIGYQKLTDEYNPSEYRMATYISGLEVEVVEGEQGTGGEFELVFNCKPQRWLNSGESETMVNNGGSLTNPTLFDSEPLLKVKGYGTIGFNGYEIELESGNIGTVNLWNNSSVNSANTSISKSFSVDMFNSTDTFSFSVGVGQTEVYEDYSSVSSTNPNAIHYHSDNNNGSIYIDVELPCTFTVGTSSTITNTSTYTYLNGKTTAFTMTVAYDGAGNITYTTSTTHSVGVSTYYPFTRIGYCTANSTLTRLGNPTYIDCELGECYKMENDTLISLNAYIDLGSDLPKLAPGVNTFTKDNTITELKVVPRWWTI